MKVLLSALVAVMLVSPALADDKTCDVHESEILGTAPAGTKFVHKLTAGELKNFLSHTKYENIDGVNLYGTPEAGKRGVVVFFTLRGDCVVGVGSVTIDTLETMLSTAEDDGSI